MALIWNDEKFSPERVIKMLEQQRQHWLETADAFERLKTYLTGTFSLHDAEENARTCRKRAQDLECTIKRLREEQQIRPIIPPPEFPTFLLQ